MKVGLMLVVILVITLTLCTACNTSNNAAPPPTATAAHLATVEASAATVEVVPRTVSLQPGESATMRVNIHGVQNLYSVELQLTYDATGLEIVDADTTREGIQIARGAFLTSAQEVNNSASEGKIDYVAMLALPADPLNGDGNLVEITCRALRAGTYTLNIHTVFLVDPQGIPIPARVISP